MDFAGSQQVSDNVRFQIAKSNIDQLFLKWLSYNTTEQLINQMLAQINEPGPLLKTPPSAMFSSKVHTHHSPKGDHGGRHNQMTPPRSPGGEKYFGRTMSP